MHLRKFLTVLISSLLISSFVPPHFLSAEEPREEYRKIQKELRKQQKRLETAKKTEVSTVRELRKTEGKLRTVEAELTARKEKIGRVRDRISVQEAEMNRTLEGLLSEQGLLKARLRALHRAGRINDALLIIITGQDMTKALRMQRYLSDISAYDARIITRYKGTLNDLNEKQAGLKRSYAELKAEERKLARTEESLQMVRSEWEGQLVSVRQEKKSYERMIKDLSEASSRLLGIIRESERRESELRKKKGPGQREEPFDESGFGGLKGRLPWPVAGTPAIPYGSQVDPLFNLPVFRSGMHIRTGEGATVKAVHEGKVVYADSFKGYGQLVIVSHGGGYHSLYGNLSRIFCKNGGIIKNYQVIGEAGESAALGTKGLYFEVRYKGKPLDPRQWLKRQ